MHTQSRGFPVLILVLEIIRYTFVHMFEQMFDHFQRSWSRFDVPYVSRYLRRRRRAKMVKTCNFRFKRYMCHKTMMKTFSFRLINGKRLCVTIKLTAPYETPNVSYRCGDHFIKVTTADHMASYFRILAKEENITLEMANYLSRVIDNDANIRDWRNDYELAHRLFSKKGEQDMTKTQKIPLIRPVQ